MNQEWHSHIIATGNAGETVEVRLEAQPGDVTVNRWEATDTSIAAAGCGTRILQVFLGQRLQMNNTVDSIDFAKRCPVDGIVCPKELTITIRVKFIVSCEWRADLWGRMSVEDGRE